ncbi:MAG: glutamine--fructose-6-phosphate transaminase (isomerizing) [Saccharospirillaceae bacterium]|nr:glutamine--fructose-6-phosphate transaminase (isomerizing) [Saccharospirillaceae bacterium]
MCGIFGVVNDQQAAQTLINGLRALEYRGYDSAGIATIKDNVIDVCRANGKLNNLETALKNHPLTGDTGIAHTRWATHGKPTVINAHPHMTDDVALVHNGIIENYQELRVELEARGHVFTSDTDSEVLPLLISDYLAKGYKPLIATKRALSRVRGTYAIGALFNGKDGQIIAARRGSPLVVGFNNQSAFIASDAVAASLMADEVIYLEEGDLALVEAGDIYIFDKHMDVVNRPRKRIEHSTEGVTKEGHDHFMHKEIHEQTTAVQRTLDGLNQLSLSVAAEMNFADIDRLHIIACGTSYYAAMVAKYWFEKLARLPVEVDLASEFRYREPPLIGKGGCLFVSQSGETADTLAALRYAKEQNQYCLSIVNVPDSSIARESDFVYRTLCGPEIGVASTKAFTSQLTVLIRLAVDAARQRFAQQETELNILMSTLGEVPQYIATALQHEAAIQQVVRIFDKATSAIFLGRGQCYPIALEGALKLKEVSYIHAEGYAAGELKHGPIALIDRDMPVVVLAPFDALFEKTISNLQEVRARGAKVILISDRRGITACGDKTDAAIEMPTAPVALHPILYSIPVQLLAYHTALMRETDVDQPRNLAKSVTVE